MARKTKSGTVKTAVPPAPTVAAPTVPATANTEAAPPESEDSPLLSEVQIGEIITRNIIGNPPVPTAAKPESGEAEQAEAAGPEPESTAEPGQESSPAETEVPETEEEVSEEQEQEQEQAQTEEGEGEEEGQEQKAEQRDWRQARIAKLKERNSALREELAELHAKVRKLEGTKPAEPESVGGPKSTIPVGHPALQEMDRHIATQEEIIRWAENNPDGAEVPDGKGNQVSYDASQVRRIRADALVNMSRALAMREMKAAEVVRSLQTEFAKHHAEAAKEFPWMLKKETPQYQEAVEIVQKAPALLGLPDHELLIGYMVEGRRVLAAKAKKLPGKVVPAPRVPGVPMATPPNTRVKIDPAAKALKRIQSGDAKGVTDYFNAHLSGRAA